MVRTDSAAPLAAACCSLLLLLLLKMVACVGQQSVGGKRCFNGFKERTLPHFPRGDKTPAGVRVLVWLFLSMVTRTGIICQGSHIQEQIVANSIFSGLTPFGSTSPHHLSSSLFPSLPPCFPINAHTQAVALWPTASSAA